MSTHLPECDLSYDCGLPHVQSYCHQCEMYCVCDRLNACTARVRAACIAAIPHLSGCFAFIRVPPDGELVHAFPDECSCGHDITVAALREVQP